MIKILYPKPGDVSRMGGKQLMEIQADTEAEIMALRARVDDGVQTFVAAPGSVAHTPDHSADWEFSPAGTWVKRGGGTPYERVILPETVLKGFEDDTNDGIPESYQLPDPWTHEPHAGAVWIINYNGKDYECEALDFGSLNPETPAGMIFVFGNPSALGSDGIPSINTDIPFCLMAMANELGEGEGQYGVMYPLPINSMPSVTLSIREKVKGESAGGKFIVRVTKGEQMESSPMPQVFPVAFTATMDKPFSEVLDATKSGKQVECWEVIEDGQTMVYILNAFGENGCGFYNMLGPFVMMITYQPDGTAYWLSSD